MGFSKNHNRRGHKLQEGLYKIEFHTVHSIGNGVIHATCRKLRGGHALQMPGVAVKAVLTRIGD